MTIETWGFNFVASGRYPGHRARRCARSPMRHAARTGWFLGEPAGGRQRRSLDASARDQLMAVAGVKSLRTIAPEETAWMNHSVADWLTVTICDRPKKKAIDQLMVDHGRQRIHSVWSRV